MLQLIENLKNGDVQLVETPVPQCGSGELLVRNHASLISPGTEKLMIEMGRKNLVGKAMARPDLVSLAYQKAKREGFLNVFREAMDRLDEPLPLGYSCAGEVMQVGKNVRGFAVGDRVACSGPAYASHADVVAVPEDLCVKLPASDAQRTLSYEEASFVMLGGIACQGIRCAELTFGETIAVVGLGLIGLLLVQIGKAYGCTVIGVDIDPEKVKLASTLGCDAAFVIGRDSIEQSIRNLTNGHGADAVILAAATKDNAPVLLAEEIARKRGRIVLVGVSDLALTRKAFWDKELSFTVSKGSGPAWQHGNSFVPLPLELVRWTESRNHQEFIRLISNGSVKVKELITHRFAIANATDGYKMILGGTERYIGVVITYGGANSVERSVLLPKGRSGSAAGSASREPRSSVGVIGAGLFTKNVLLPAASKVPGLNFVGIAAKTGVSSRHVGNKFRFAYATTDVNAILEDKRIGSVLITTRHNLHADQIVAALAAGKNVFVEKPLCISAEQLAAIKDAYDKSSGLVLMVGFNRRYSPLGIRLKALFEGRTSPMQIHYRVNAGFLPPDHWTQDPNIGGGRIIGEVCHFIDLLQFITMEDPVEVFASSIGGNTGRFAVGDNVNLSIGFSGGSLGTITYTALGSKAFSRERIEVYCDETIGVVEDFKRLEFIKGAKKKISKLWNQDPGFLNELNHFLTVAPEDARVLMQSAILTTLATFAAETSLRTRTSVSIARTESAA